MENILQYFIKNEVESLINSGKIDNEYGLQFELGLYLRDKGYGIFFEKNIGNKNTCKHEIDLVVEDSTKKKRYAIELKCTKGVNKGGKDEIYRFFQDIQFCEELKANNEYDETFCITLVDCECYYKLTKRKVDPLWRCFRGEVNNCASVRAEDKINGVIPKYVKNEPKGCYNINGTYQIEWNYLFTDSKNKRQYWYYIIKVQS